MTNLMCRLNLALFVLIILVSIYEVYTSTSYTFHTIPIVLIIAGCGIFTSFASAILVAIDSYEPDKEVLFLDELKSPPKVKRAIRKLVKTMPKK